MNIILATKVQVESEIKASQTMQMNHLLSWVCTMMKLIY